MPVDENLVFAGSPISAVYQFYTLALEDGDARFGADANLGPSVKTKLFVVETYLQEEKAVGVVAIVVLAWKNNVFCVYTGLDVECVCVKHGAEK